MENKFVKICEIIMNYNYMSRNLQFGECSCKEDGESISSENG